MPSANGFKNNAAVQLPPGLPPVYDPFRNALILTVKSTSRFGDRHWMNGFEDRSHRREAFARNDRTQFLLPHANFARACPRSV